MFLRLHKIERKKKEKLSMKKANSIHFECNKYLVGKQGILN